MHMFAGTSSPGGFADYFDHIILPDKAVRRYFLKGPSGSGKSTFMKKIKTTLISGGYSNIESFYCANDAASLDAIALPDRGLSMMDATAPHARDAQIYGATDIVIDFGNYVKFDQIKQHEDEIKQILRNKKTLRAKAEGYMAALGKVYTANVGVYESALIKIPFEALVGRWAALLDDYTQHGFGSNRKLFVSAVTPGGAVCFAEDVFSDATVYGICTEGDAGLDAFLKRVQQEANRRGLDTTSFYNPLAPQNLQYLYLPQQNIAFAPIRGNFAYCGKIAQKIDLGPCLDKKMLMEMKCDMEDCEGLLDIMVDETVQALARCKIFHNRLEEIYAAAMDFSAINELSDRIAQEIAFLLS